jgi:hypothetical protein
VGATQSPIFVFEWIALIDIILNIPQGVGIKTLCEKDFHLGHIYKMHVHTFEQRIWDKQWC